jgi:2,4-dienoyl-CoA reductase-like NADH-dependent reductase (Old Yellow Enzyme family)
VLKRAAKLGGIFMKLFEPFSLCGLTLKNRIVRSATYEKLADPDGFVTGELIDRYASLADGGAGLLITGNTIVHPSGRSVPQAMAIHNDDYIAGLKRLADAVHEHGGIVVMQISHGGRQCFPILLDGNDPIAPSAVFDSVMKIMPREMTDDEIWATVEAFTDAAYRVFNAGFDGVQLHAAHGYLINEFLSPYTNRRNDYWGGSEEKRFHFVLEILNAIRRKVGENLPVLVKMNGEDLLPDGLKLAESIRIAKRLEASGVCAIEVSGGMLEAGSVIIRPTINSTDKEAYFRNEAAAFKKELRIPVITVGGIRSRSVAEDIIASGDADLVSFSRPLLCEPDLPNLFMAGKECADCTSCNNCLKFMKLEKVCCTQPI